MTGADLAALRLQGFVTAERRGNRTCFKLRFRRGRQQIVRYIGSNPDKAEAVQRELDHLQEERKTELELSRLTKKAKKILRESKRVLVPLLAKEGFAFHGRQIRRRRLQRSTK
ncbi:MAG: hypothetical protein H8E44_40260 [Planctomycetes bacterium]|nr:hypothetical protein [Planctomycetota bacterium]